MRDNPNNMESFYDEENATFSSQNNLKRPLTLDLNGKQQTTKRSRFNPSVNTVSVLNSPDLQMLKMASPELEKFIMATNALQTPTPSLVYPTKVNSVLFYIAFPLVPWTVYTQRYFFILLKVYYTNVPTVALQSQRSQRSTSTLKNSRKCFT